MPDTKQATISTKEDTSSLLSQLESSATTDYRAKPWERFKEEKFIENYATKDGDTHER